MKLSVIIYIYIIIIIILILEEYKNFRGFDDGSGVPNLENDDEEFTIHNIDEEYNIDNYIDLRTPVQSDEENDLKGELKEGIKLIYYFYSYYSYYSYYYYYYKIVTN